MPLFAAAARYRRGELLGGTEGTTLIDEAASAMANENIREPARMAAALAPVCFQ
jgi:hypothetical protein